MIIIIMNKIRILLQIIIIISLLLNELIAINNNDNRKELRIAFCVTGQLARLELASKVYNIFIENAKLGHRVDVFIFLDPDITDVKQTYWNYNYTHSIFGDYSASMLKKYIDDRTFDAGYGIKGPGAEFLKPDAIDDGGIVVKGGVKVRVRLEPPPRWVFHVVDGEIPVKDKPFSGHDGPKSNFESAATRFQNNLRWMAGLRECTRWLQVQEYKQKWFYDIVVRLRDDSYAMGPWKFNELYRGVLMSTKTGTYEGINDHNFAVDRFWAENLFRGLSEDYYFNGTLYKAFWGNPEHRIHMIATAYNIPLRYTNICEQPLIPLRGLVNSSYWRLHPLYIRHVKEECEEATGPEHRRELRGTSLSITYKNIKYDKKASNNKQKRSPQNQNTQQVTQEKKTKTKQVKQVPCCDPEWLELLTQRTAPVQ